MILKVFFIFICLGTYKNTAIVYRAPNSPRGEGQIEEVDQCLRSPVESDWLCFGDLGLKPQDARAHDTGPETLLHLFASNLDV